jgi:hypothetical protein
MTENRRASDNLAAGWFWVTLRKMDGVFKRLGLIVCLFIATFAVFVAYLAVRNVEGEARERRDATCELFERQEHAAVLRLISTYEYLETLPRSEYGSTLTKAVLRNLGATEADARAVIAPAFCNAPGVGLRERGAPELPEDRDYDDRGRKP